MTNNGALQHSGKIGMKWGVRKDAAVSAGAKKQGRISKLISNRRRIKAERAAAKLLKASQDKWDENFNKNWVHAYNNAADYANNTLIPKLDKKYGGIFVGSDVEKHYERAFNKFLTKEYDKMFGKRPE